MALLTVYRSEGDRRWLTMASRRKKDRAALMDRAARFALGVVFVHGRVGTALHQLDCRKAVLFTTVTFARDGDNLLICCPKTPSPLVSTVLKDVIRHEFLFLATERIQRLPVRVLPRRKLVDARNSSHVTGRRRSTIEQAPPGSVLGRGGDAHTREGGVLCPGPLLGPQSVEVRLWRLSQSRVSGGAY